MLTTAALKAYTLKDLAQMAKKRGLAGWHSMRKDQLVRALAKLEKNNSSNGKSSNGKAARKTTKKATTTATRSKKAAGRNGTPSSNGKPHAKTVSKLAKGTSRNGSASRKSTKKPKDPRVARKIQQAQESRERLKDLSQQLGNEDQIADNGAPRKDRLVLMVRDPYWIHAYWEIGSRSIERAQVAMAENWHGAVPVLRLLKITSGQSEASSEEIAREVEIHGAVRNWYIDVIDPPSSFRAEIGYRTLNGQFHALARSNSVTTPQPGSHEMLDGNWADVAENCEKIYAMSGGYEESCRNGELQELFEERLRRPMGSPMVTRFGAGAEGVLERRSNMRFEIDAEMIVYGITKSDAYVTMGGEPVKLREDGSFTARVALPERRQVLPVVASTPDGVEQQTIVLAVERNTKVMEPVVRDQND